ncbi:adenine methyltransferase [Bacillus sp. PR5]|nr:adenine methyltransferase [Bacillus sp. PR5]
MNWAPLPEGPFDLIAADPNWRFTAFSDKGLGRAPERHYKTATLDEICSLPVRDVAATNCHLMLWITGPALVAGYHGIVLRAWGFEPSAIGFVWVKNLKHNELKLAPSDYRIRKDGILVLKKHISASDFKMGLGHTTRQNAEFVVLGRRGRPRRYSKAVHQLIVDPLREHSRKPDAFFQAAEKYAAPDARRLELFARQPRAGWTSWGDEINKFAEAA